LRCIWSVCVLIGPLWHGYLKFFRMRRRPAWCRLFPYTTLFRSCAHPFKGTKLIAAPLVVFSEEHHSEGHEIKKESSFAFRIGAGYDFHVGKLSLGPTVDFDFGKTEALNYGLSIGFGF